MKKIKLADWTITIPNQSSVNQHHKITGITLKDIELMTDDEWQAELKALLGVTDAFSLCCFLRHTRFPLRR